MIRKFLYIIATLCVISSVVFGADASSTTASDIVKGEYLLNSGQYKCRDVASDYRTEIDGYDLLTGTVYCKIYPNSKKVTSDKALAGDAGTRNIAQSYKHWLENDKKASTLKKIENIQNQGLKYAKDALGGYEVTDIEEKDGFKMSDYLTGLAVLKNFDVEKAAGMEATTTETTGFFTKLFGGDDNGGTTTKVTNVAKNLNQANINYFKNLFYEMNEVYIHLQNLLFIVVGGFFLATLGGGKIQKYLENRGQSTGNKEPYLHKFFIPLLCAGVFYMPITSGGGVNSTMIQKIIQYFTTEANNIANVASNIGSQTYMRKIQESTGIADFKVDGELITETTKFQAEFIQEKAEQELKKCYTKFGEDKEALFLDKDLLSWTEMQSQKELSQGILDKLVSGFSDFLKSVSSFTLGSGTDDISFSACKQLIQEKINAEKTLKEIEQKEKELEKSSGSEDKAEDRQKMAIAAADVQSMIRNNERMYGWLNSLIVPSSVMLFEMQSLAQNSQTQTFEDLQKAINTQNTYSAQNNNQSEALSDSVFAKASQWLTSYLLPLTLPGASSLRTTILNAGYDEKTGKVTSNLVRFGVWDGACGYATYKEVKDASSIIGKMGATAAGIICASGYNDPKGFGGFVGSLFIIHAIYTSVLEYLPTVIASVAGILAFLGYFVSLCKYYYISPFVVAFALTTKRVDKIINFLITGITIFFKPVLIVLFIYLALFLHHIIQEIFILTSLTQFSVLPESMSESIDFFTPMATGIIKSLLMFFGSIASCYILWKTIMTGPDWTFKLLGLDNHSNSDIVAQMSSKLETKATVV